MKTDEAAMIAAKATNTTMPFENVQARDRHNATDTISDDISFGGVHITPPPSHSRSFVQTQIDISFDSQRAITEFENFPTAVSSVPQGTTDMETSFHIDHTVTETLYLVTALRREAVSAEVVLDDSADVEPTPELGEVMSFGAFLPKNAGPVARRRRRT